MNYEGTIRDQFAEVYGVSPRVFRAPGRVNLIGEHTDYNEGFVLPIAINRETVVAATARADRLLRVRSLNLNESAEFDLDSPGTPRRGAWTDYVQGVAQALISRGSSLRGADLLIGSDVPIGAGLSSSAALEISVGFALLSVSETAAGVDRISLALAGQQAEHEYVGINSGIMDQYVAALGRAGHALLIDCRSLESHAVPFDTSSNILVICNTGVKHALADSAYNQRRRECESGVESLKQFLPDITALRDVSPEEFRRYEAHLPEPIRRRCRHVVTEDQRTLEAVEALSADDFQRFGQLMYQSHESLRVDYEVTCAELDFLVDTARTLPGVFGARMTGGGFGGCTITLVRAADVDGFRSEIARLYRGAFGREAEMYVSSAADGASEVFEN